MRWYGVVSLAILLTYVVVAPWLWAGRGFDATGPLSKDRSAATSPPAGATLALDDAVAACRTAGILAEEPLEEERVHLVAGHVDGSPLYACYDLRDGGGVWYGGVIDARTGLDTTVAEILKPAGVWRWIAAVKTPGEVVGGGVAAAAWLWLYGSFHRRVRGRARLPLPELLGWTEPGPAPRSSRAAPTVVGRWLGPRLVYVYLAAMALAWGALVFAWFEVAAFPDALAIGVVGLVTLAGLWGWFGGWWLIEPTAGSGGGWRPDVSPSPRFIDEEGRVGRWPWSRDRSEPGSDRVDETDRPGVPVGSSLTRLTTGDPPASVRVVDGSAGPQTLPAVPRDDAVEVDWGVKEPAALPTFADVGGMDDLKQRLRDSVGLLLAFGTEAEAFRITYNGILLHGPPGTGKSFVAEATAGEHGLRFLRVDVSDIVSKWVGESARNIRAAFEVAAANIPCLLFLDEFDAIAARRDDEASGEARRTVNQLLQSIEEWRDVRELVVVAATNHLDRLDPAVIRPGRFDKHVRIDLPDREARRAVLDAQLRDRPRALGIDLDLVAERTEGMTPAAIAACVQAAALAAFRETTLDGQLREVTTAHLLGALQARGGQDRPSVEGWNWDRLILDDATKAELRRVQLLIEDPERARAYGVTPPTGMLLAGPPGTGKTTIARVFAAEGSFSFYPVTVTDLTSKWVGEGEEKVARLFQRARENAPSVIFIDEIDAIAAKRGDGDYGDRLVNQLLAEMDGIAGRGRVFVAAATNRPELLDPALTRGGRLSRTVHIGLPRAPERRALLALFTASMPLAGVDLDELAAMTAGWSGADLEALCQQAAIEAMVRDADRSGAVPLIEAQDVDLALAAVRAVSASSVPDPLH
jgi:transitional endoplasmic reticulum ATPase